MIEEQSVVTAISGNKVTVKSQLKSGCSGCQQVDNCGSGQVAKAIPQLSLVIDITTKQPLKVGDKVVIGIPEKSLLSTAATVYLLPLLGLLFGAGFGQYLLENTFFSHELQALAVGFGGALLGYIAAKIILRSAKQAANLTPQLLRKIV